VPVWTTEELETLARYRGFCTLFELVLLFGGRFSAAEIKAQLRAVTT
jgi:hypothetical protein